MLAACTPPPNPPAPPPPPQLTLARANRVVLVTFDGLSADELPRFGASAFEEMPARVTRVIPVEPTATSSTHAALLTGETPDKTGIVSNQFHMPGTPRTQVAKGLETEIATEMITETAHRAGKTVGGIAFPFIDWISPRRSVDFGIAWSPSLTRPRVIHLARSDFHPDWLPPSWGQSQTRHPSYSPVMRSRVEWTAPGAQRQEVDLVAYDSTDDRVENYDTLFVEYGGGESPLDASRWFSVSEQTPDGKFGSWSKVLRFAPNLAAVDVYWGSVAKTRGERQFVREVEERIGFWPGTADDASVRDGSIGADTFTEQNDRLANYLADVMHYATTTRHFDLLLAYQPLIDAAAHQFLTPEGEGVRRASYATFNRVVAGMRRDAAATQATIFITGDHGLAPVDTEVRIIPILNGLNEPQWSVFANGGVVHFYRFGGDDDTDTLIAKLTALRASDGAPVFERVMRKPASAHPNAGDITAFTYPRFAMSMSPTGEPFAKPGYSGQHGGLNTHPEFHTTLAVDGPAVTPQKIEAMPQTGIAPLILRLLGL